MPIIGEDGKEVKPPPKKYDAKNGTRLTDCCGAYSTFHDMTLCCKKCWREVGVGEGDGSEKRTRRN